MTVGERIRTIRTDKGLTQRDLAARLDVSQQSVMQWENGIRHPKTDTLKRIAEALNVSYWKLAGDADDPNNYIPTIQDPGYVANMILNDVTALEALAEYNGKPLTPQQQKSILYDLVDRRAEQYKISSNMLLNEIYKAKGTDSPIAKPSDQLLKEMLRIIGEMNLDGQIAALHHIRELAQIPSYQKEH